ncbi:uncharacterized protein PV06_08357 [Exophiala oligosperma]|uniref:Uncharacterized protein n=1 Tax=Exophiala oligosperma TaxID=215243 RepID=A0A0D2BQH6_9EURO|nr:uncharacterized protein PV06_08357 [Exophiala oligosperma]KIW39772.1 hypothetical protein PV06_08357 [Exophiala oligosperma]
MSSTVLVRSALNPPVPNLPTLTLSPRDEPNEDEKHGYYYGIPSRPLLVARSNTQPWQSHPFSSSWPSAKTLQAVERSHPIAEAWCSGLFRQIIEVLKNVSFTTIDVVRIGYLQDKELPPVVLWIGVPNNSLSSRVGNEIVDACVEILRRYQLFDVQCEIRESEYRQSAPSPTCSPTYLAPETATFASGGFPAQLIASPGQSINLAGSTAHGSLGPYLRAGKGNPDAEGVYAITCRHAALPGTDLEENFDWKRAGQPLKNILLPSDATVCQELKEINSSERIHKVKRLDIREKLMVCLPEEEERLKLRLERLHHETNLREDRQQLLSAWAPKENRVFGHVVTAPPLRVAKSSDPSGLGSIVDWALIKVHLKKQSDGKVMNWINFKPDETAQVNDMMIHHLEHHPESRFDLLKESTLCLSRAVPANELHFLFKPIEFLPEKDFQRILVGMKGAHSGLTWGQVNGVSSIVSHHDTNKGTQETLSMELCVLPFLRTNDKAFSQCGDSGSAVFDLEGRIVGIVHGGSGSLQKASKDVTYVSLMADIQRGLNERGYSVEIA